MFFRDGRNAYLLVQQVFNFFRYLKDEFKNQGCFDVARSLTYTSLFAVVPLMTVIYVVLSAVPLFTNALAQLQAIISDNFVPAAGAEALNYAQQFSEQAKNLTGLGVLMLAATSYFMLKNVEHAFNKIWHVKNPRRGLRSFLVYWAVLSLGPLFLGAALAMRTYVISLTLLVHEAEILDGINGVFTLMPGLLTVATFTLLYSIVPNCRVPLRFALIGGLVAAAVFFMIKALFSWGIQKSSYQIVYGAFATVPLFLLWLHLSWLVILAGAQLVKGLSSHSFNVSGGRLSDTWLKLLVLELFWQKQKQAKVLDVEETLDYFRKLKIANMDLSKWHDIKDDFVEHNIIIAVSDGGYVLKRDLDDLPLWKILATELEAFRTDLDNLQLLENKHWCRELAKRIAEANVIVKNSLQISVAEFFRKESQ